MTRPHIEARADAHRLSVSAAVHLTEPRKVVDHKRGARLSQQPHAQVGAYSSSLLDRSVAARQRGY